MNRRIRQHNSEIPGGAKCTKLTDLEFKWEIIATLSPFLSRSEVSRWEKLIKNNNRGIKNRLDAMESVSKGLYPSSFTDKQKTKYSLPVNLILNISSNNEFIPPRT